MRRAAGVLALGLLAGCGYTLAGRGNFLPAHVRSIGIPTFQNQSDRIEIEELFTESVVQEFNSRGRYTITADETGVDAVLYGTVLEFSAAPAVLQGGEDPQTANQAARYSVVVRAKVEFKDLVQNRVIWEDASFSFRDEYEIGEDPEAFFDQQGLALERLSEDFAKTLVSRILEAF